MANLMRSVIKRLLPSPVKVRHSEYSMLYSVDDDKSRPSPRLVETCLQVFANTRGVSLDDISKRMHEPPYFVEYWPGEHYRLLASFVQILKPKLVIEIGTYRGLSALALKKFLPPSSQLVTFDVLDWKTLPETSLKEEDFKDGQMRQILDDLADPKIVEKHRALLEEADFFFIDAAKDGVMEQKFLENFKMLNFKKQPLLIFDDIRIWKMLKIWREIPLPKIDITSFGHWTGTGVVEWQKH